MNSTKTFALLKTLSKKEILDLGSIIKKNKRKSLNEIFLLCNKTIKQKRNVNLKSFFKQFYNKEYNKKDDNQLRNELRLLNNVIEQFIVEIQISKEVKQNDYFQKKLYFNFILENESFDLLEKELNKVFKQIETKEDYNYFYDFFLIWTKLQSKNFKMESKYFVETKAFFDKLYHFWKQEVGIKTKKVEIFKSFLNRASFMVSRDLNFDENDSFIDFNEIKNNNYFNFLSNKSNSLKANAEEKIEILLLMNTQLEKLKVKDINFSQEKFTLLQYLGIEYMIKSENETAFKYFKESTLLSNSIDDNIFTKGLYNLISTSIKLEKFEEAIKMFNEHYEKIKKSNIIGLFHCIITMSYVFSGEINNAEQSNKVIDSTKSVGNFLYTRCNLAVIFYENNEKELALNELTNITQSVNYHKNQDVAYKDFTSFFKIFIQSTFTKSLIKENQVKLKKMNNTIQENFKKSTISYGADSLHLLWLHKKIEKIISS